MATKPPKPSKATKISVFAVSFAFALWCVSRASAHTPERGELSEESLMSVAFIRMDNNIQEKVDVDVDVDVLLDSLRNATSGYSCAELLVNTTNSLSFMKVPTSAKSMDDDTQASRHVCDNHMQDFYKSLIMYSELKRRCEYEEYHNELNNYFFELRLTVFKFPCLLARRDCSGDDVLCKPPEIFNATSMRAPGSKTINTCLDAINHSCELNKNQAICKCPNGVCHLSYSKTSTPSPKNMSVTELYADPYLRHFGNLDGNFQVNVSSHPLSRFWTEIPVIWEPVMKDDSTNCDLENETEQVILHGEIRNCTKGFHCPMADGHIQRITFCKPGYYCETSGGEPKKCPAGYYCPAAMWKPLKCQALSVCPEGAVVDTPFIGVISAIVLLVIVIVAYRIARNREETSWTIQARDEGKGEKLFTKVRQDNEEENEHMEVEVDAATVMKDVEAHLNIKFYNLSVTIPPEDGKSEPKTIMSGVTGKFMSGKVTAVMGPSGSGKTTLISSLLGQISRSGGEVKINGEIDELTEYRKIIGFVPQDDVMLTTLTVREVLTHSAITRLPASWSKKDVATQVNAVLHLLDLSRVQNTIIGDGTNRGISGGQRKRVNIGMELVMNPAMIILDEPTTGLDSSTALEVVRYLKLVATQGRTVVSIIHQPRYETFAMFDQVLMLAKGGRTVYEGKASRALEYFTQLNFHLPANTNPADFFMDVISGKVPRHGFPEFQPLDLVKIWEDTSSGQGPSAIPRSATTESVNLPIAPVSKDIRVAPNLISQMIACTMRAFSQKYRQPSFTKTFLLIHLAIAFALGSGFAQGSRMYLPPFPLWLAKFCPPVIRDLCEEQTLFDTAVVQV